MQQKLTTLSFLLSMMAIPTSLLAEDASEFFESRVRPILVDRCGQCHLEKQKGALSLATREGLLRGGRRGAAVSLDQPEKSLLLQAVSHTHKQLRMPPGQKLPADELAVLKKWITDGAAWGTEAHTPIAARSPEEWRSSFWSFRPIASPPVPALSDSPYGEWSSHPIDRFIAQQWIRRGLSPAEPADARTLIRRMSFNLTGLPPTITRVRKFEERFAAAPDAAVRELAEEYLSTRHYGERWGQNWLDLVRYADTAGDAADYPIPEAYKYRNYVIDAFNDDKPYDQFIREQIAGDLLHAGSEAERWQQTIATGYLAISRRIGVSPHGQRHITIEDTIDNLGKTFLGLTLACARCHDHKFDPVPTEDYYALYGIFDSSTYPHAGAEHKPYREGFVYRVGQEAADEKLDPYRKQLEPFSKEERRLFEVYRDFQRKKITDPNRSREKAWAAVLKARDRRAEIARTFPDLETAYAVHEGQPHDAHIQEQGDPSKGSQGELVRRGFLQVLGGQELPKDCEESGRRELAEWLTSPENPLTARVIVNRVWHHHFGRGLVETTSDFGVRGTPPSHPQLLDYLAKQLIQNGWSLKWLHRTILTSSTWRLGSTSPVTRDTPDPGNIYLWRANRRRLSAEEIRDALLTFSQALDTSPAGRHPFPHRLTYFYRQHEPFVGEFSSNRRSVYLMRQRIRKNEYLDLFDSPDGNVHMGERRETTTTLQALFLMNSGFIADHARKIAQVTLLTDGPARDGTNRLLELVYQRSPTRDEQRQLTSYLSAKDHDIETSTNAAGIERATGLVRAVLSSNEFLYLD